MQPRLQPPVYENEPWSFLSCLGQFKCSYDGCVIFSESRPVYYTLQMEGLTCSRLSTGGAKPHSCLHSIYESFSSLFTILRRLPSLSALLNTEYTLISDSLGPFRDDTASPILSSVRQNEWPLPRPCPMSSECQTADGTLYVSTP